MEPVKPAVESGWVNLCPLLQVRPPHPLAQDQDPQTKDVKEIFEFFRDRNPEDPMGAFMTKFNSLPVISDMGETKLSQVLKAIRLMKIARDADITRRRANKTLRAMGIKR